MWTNDIKFSFRIPLYYQYTYIDRYSVTHFGFVNRFRRREQGLSSAMASAADGKAPAQKQWLSKQTELDLVRLVFAGGSSVIAQFFTHPVETVKIRMQVEGQTMASGQAPRYPNVIVGSSYIFRNEGMTGLYKVMSPRPSLQLRSHVLFVLGPAIQPSRSCLP